MKKQAFKFKQISSSVWFSDMFKKDTMVQSSQYYTVCALHIQYSLYSLLKYTYMSMFHID